MSSHGSGNSHAASLTSVNSASGRARHHRHHSWPIADYVQKPTLALVSLLFPKCDENSCRCFKLLLRSEILFATMQSWFSCLF